MNDYKGVQILEVFECNVKRSEEKVKFSTFWLVADEEQVETDEQKKEKKGREGSRDDR